MNYHTNTHGFRLCWLLLAITLCASLTLAQSGRRISKPTSDQISSDVLKIGTVEINLSVTVRDSLGKVVNGLGAEDFFIYDNGRRYQPIYFENRHVPINLVLLLDASGSFFDGEAVIHKTLLAFCRKLQPKVDRIAVMRFSDHVSLDEDWNNRESILREALKRNEHSSRKSAIYDALLAAAEKLSETEGRRAILLLTSGLNSAGQVHLSEALSAIQRANAALYVLSETEAIANAIRGKSSNAEILSSLPKLELAERNLTWLAERSGGGIYFPLQLSSLDWMLAELADEFRAQYLLTYQPVEDVDEHPSNRRIEVLVRGGHKTLARFNPAQRRSPSNSKLISSSSRFPKY